MNIWFQTQKATGTFEERTTCPLGNCHSLNLNVSWDKNWANYFHRTTNYSMTKKLRRWEFMWNKNQGQRYYKIEHASSRKICIFWYHTMETSVTWHSYVVNVWNFLNFLQKIRRPKSSDIFTIRNICKYSLPCPQDPCRMCEEIVTS